MNVLLIQGSPRGRRANTGSILAFLATELAIGGAQSETYAVSARGPGPDDLDGLHAQLAAADAVVLAAPVYLDTVPAATQRLFESLSARGPGPAPPLYGIAHSGYFEPVHKLCELRTMRLFCEAMGWSWRGGVGFGGTSPIEGRPLEDLGGLTRRLRAGLQAVAADIAAGRPLSQKTVALCSRPPLPLPTRPVVWLTNRQGRKERRKVDAFARPYDRRP